MKGLIVILVLSSCCLAVEYNRENEGYPNGFWYRCHRSELPAEISDKSLRYLRFTVHAQDYKRTYNYWQAMKGIPKDSHFDRKKKTAIFVSGYLDSAEFVIPQIAAFVYIKQNYNVILVDTNRFTTMFYTVASRLSRPVGRRIAEMLMNLTRHGYDPANIEMVGLSLGSHTIAFAAKHFQKLSGGLKLGRLTGLDPASPCFRKQPSYDRLNASDALFVDIIHTNIDGMGMATPAGHVDIYVNGGEWQPGGMEWLPCDVLCSHLRSFWLWLAAVTNSKEFIAMKCKSVQQARDSDCYDNEPMSINYMGLATNKRNPGIFYLATSNQSPYHLGERGLSKSMNAWKLFGTKYNKEDVLIV